MHDVAKVSKEMIVTSGKVMKDNDIVSDPEASLSEFSMGLSGAAGCL